MDRTCIPTAEDWLYLAGVIDGFSKRIVGYAMAKHMRIDLVLSLEDVMNSGRTLGHGQEGLSLRQQ